MQHDARRVVEGNLQLRRLPAPDPVHPLLALQRAAGNRAVTAAVQRRRVDHPLPPPGGLAEIVRRQTVPSPGVLGWTKADQPAPSYVVTSAGFGFRFVHTHTVREPTAHCWWPTAGDHRTAGAGSPTSRPALVVRVAPAISNLLRDGEHEHAADADVVFRRTMGRANAAMARMDGQAASGPRSEALLRQRFASLLPQRWQAGARAAPWVADCRWLARQARNRRDSFAHIGEVSPPRREAGTWLRDALRSPGFARIQVPADTSAVDRDAASLGL